MRKEIFTGTKDRAEKLQKTLADFFGAGRFFLVRTDNIKAGKATYAVQQLEMMDAGGKLEELSIYFAVEFIADGRKLAVYSYESLWVYDQCLDVFERVVPHTRIARDDMGKGGKMLGYVWCRIATQAGYGQWRGELFDFGVSAEQFTEIMGSETMRNFGELFSLIDRR